MKRERSERECEEYEKESGGGWGKTYFLETAFEVGGALLCVCWEQINKQHTHSHTHTPSNTHLAQILKFRNSLLKIMEK